MDNFEVVFPDSRVSSNTTTRNHFLRGCVTISRRKRVVLSRNFSPQRSPPYTAPLPTLPSRSHSSSTPAASDWLKWVVTISKSYWFNLLFQQVGPVRLWYLVSPRTSIWNAESLIVRHCGLPCKHCRKREDPLHVFPGEILGTSAKANITGRAPGSEAHHPAREGEFIEVCLGEGSSH